MDGSKASIEGWQPRIAGQPGARVAGKRTGSPDGQCGWRVISVGETLGVDGDGEDEALTATAVVVIVTSDAWGRGSAGQGDHEGNTNTRRMGQLKAIMK